MYVFSSPAETLLANVVRDNPPLAITPESVAVDIGCVQEALEPLLKVAGNHIDKCDLQVFFTRLSHIKAPIISTPARTMGDETVIMSFPLANPHHRSVSLPVKYAGSPCGKVLSKAALLL